MTRTTSPATSATLINTVAHHTKDCANTETAAAS
jgi:hypothetical protein